MVFKVYLYSILLLTLVLSGCDTEESETIMKGSYAVREIYWTHRTDSDHDGFSSSGVLNVEVDLGKNIAREVTVRLFYKGANETVWTWLEDKTVVLYSNRNDAVRFTGFASKYYYGYYDFRLIISAWQESNLLYNAVVGPEGDPDLNNQKFEYDGEDLRYDP